MLNFIKSKYFDGNIIEFYTKKELIDIIEHPRPSIKFMPEWFRVLPQDVRGEKFDNIDDNVADPRRDKFGQFHKTAKGCPPLLDAFSLGVTIPFPADIHVKTNHNLSSITVYEPFKETFNLVEEHPEFQIGGAANIQRLAPHGVKNIKVLKFLNPWIVKTPPGWSTLFIHPINNFNLPFICLGGVVETDKYFNFVNFPALWVQENADIHLNAGTTPMVTCIPFKRTNHNKKVISKALKENEFKKHWVIHKKITGGTASFYKRKIRGSDND